jgi:LmbE family N-acetylglucosaminyl deacetylase
VTRRNAALVVAVSGPDGTGKSSLVEDLVPALHGRGLAAVTAYCYGCVFCRRVRTPMPASTGGRGRRGLTWALSLLGRSHALVDAAELAGRLAGARFRARVTARNRRAVVVTDRGPLDGLAKFDPAPGSRAAALFTRIGRSYDLTLLLDAGPDVLAARDGEHTAAQLSEARKRYQRWERLLPAVERLGTQERPERVAAEALRRVLSDDRCPPASRCKAIAAGNHQVIPACGSAGPLTEAMHDADRLVVLSPHLDDAVLSCGALMSHARTRMPVTVATFFTEAGAPPYTLSARAYLRQVRADDAQQLYLARRAEDREVLEGAAIGYIHAGLTEALFRRRTRPLLDRFPWAGRLMPEMSYVYPTHRLHIARGRISPHDAETVRRILEAIDHLSLTPSTLLLAPLAIGGHVDHMLVRTAAERSQKRVAYYSDFPYYRRYPADPVFAQRNALVQVAWAGDLAAKPALIRGYRTQVDALFPGGEIPLAPEVYLFPAQQETSGTDDGQ